ncbi:MAG TPA: helix-turn-helix transcriptional regulator [Solirubrobacteraceae bacterium]|nr:helix-turn-helix transcriptional regulator [Solirubrobacteraceae bacterium]
MDARVLAIVEDVIGVVELDEFRLALLRSLMRVVPSDWASLNDLGPDPDDIAVLVIPEPPPDLIDLYAAHRDENPIAAYIARTHDGRATRFSDHVTTAELEATPLYQLVYRPMRAHHQIAFTLASSSDRMLAIALSRADPDYTDDERDVLNRTRPLLISAFRAAIEHTSLRRSLAQLGDIAVFAGVLEAAGLTAREAQVVCLVAFGSSNRDVAGELGVSNRTVGKHLEHAFRKLEVRTRSEAAARAWALVRAVGGAAEQDTTGPRLQPPRKGGTAL